MGTISAPQQGLTTSSAPSFAGITLTGDMVVATKTPASASAAGTAGTIAWDTSYLYVCTATNTWERVAVASW
jgi:hypothetical protein